MIGYVRVSTREQSDDGFSLDAQRAAIADYAERQGWDVEFIEDPGVSARSDKRPGLQEALRRLKRREAAGLIVMKLDRLARSVQNFTSFIKTAQRQRWRIVITDFNLDTASPNGRLVAHILAAVAEWESDMIGQRTADGMAEAKEQGARFGRQRQADDTTVKRICAEREEGASFPAIAARLDADGIPTPGGGKRWYASTVARLCEAAA